MKDAMGERLQQEVSFVVAEPKQQSVAEQKIAELEAIKNPSILKSSELSLWKLIAENRIFLKRDHTIQIHWVQPVGEVADIGIMIDDKFHDNAVLALDREYTAELIAAIFDLKIVETQNETK